VDFQKIKYIEAMLQYVYFAEKCFFDTTSEAQEQITLKKKKEQKINGQTNDHPISIKKPKPVQAKPIQKKSPNFIVELMFGLKEMCKLACYAPDKEMACQIYHHQGIFCLSVGNY
jgi:hypothetical protein